jgi:peptidoglycan hydrolase CwlO-like protein
VAAHTFREALEDISVDSKLDALIAKVSQLEEKLEALDDSIDETPKPKAKDKRKPRAKKSG